MTETNEDFIRQLQSRREQKAREYVETSQQLKRLEVEQERAKEYLEMVDSLLEAEGVTPRPLKESLPVRTHGKTGNREKDMPVRKAQWEEMSVNQIIQHVLDASPNLSYHPAEMAREIYEIQSEVDLNKVLRNVRSAMQKGQRKELWAKATRGRFKSKAGVAQGKLVTVN